jgi:hypothetical protein
VSRGVDRLGLAADLDTAGLQGWLHVVDDDRSVVGALHVAELLGPRDVNGRRCQWC